MVYALRTNKLEASWPRRHILADDDRNRLPSRLTLATRPGGFRRGKVPACRGPHADMELKPRDITVIMHGLLAHAAVANASDKDRIAIYFRTWPHPAAGMRSLSERLCDAGVGWCCATRRQVDTTEASV